MSANDPLDETAGEKLLPIMRGLVGIIPVVGGLLGEIITEVIPHQRADRVSAYLRLLAVRLEALEARAKDRIATDEQRVALIEDGVYQASRAVGSDRLQQLVACVVAGVSSDDRDQDYHRKLLEALGQLSDYDLLALQAHVSDGIKEKVAPPRPYVGPRKSEDIRANAHWNVTRAKLERLDLLRAHEIDLQEADPSKGRKLRITRFGLDLMHSAEIIHTLPPWADHLS
jgi:hypothetical protein